MILALAVVPAAVRSATALRRAYKRPRRKALPPVMRWMARSESLATCCAIVVASFLGAISGLSAMVPFVPLGACQPVAAPYNP